MNVNDVTIKLDNWRFLS